MTGYLDTVDDLAVEQLVSDGVAPNVLRAQRAARGLSHAVIDEYEARLWRATGRDGEARW